MSFKNYFVQIHEQLIIQPNIKSKCMQSIFINKKWPHVFILGQILIKVENSV